MTIISNLNSYFSELDDILSQETWEAAEQAAKLLSIRDEHAHYDFLQVGLWLYVLCVLLVLLVVVAFFLRSFGKVRVEADAVVL